MKKISFECMNNQEYNSFKRKMNIYKNFVNDRTLNNLSNRVKRGELEPGRALVKAFNIANVDYKKKSYEFYANMAKTFAGNAVSKMGDETFRKKVRNAMNKYPKQPPCVPVEGGKSGGRKTTEAIARMCGGFCARQVQKACGAVGTAATTVAGLGKRRRSDGNNTGRINNSTRVEKIRNIVKNGVLKNVNNNSKNNTSYTINTMSEYQLRQLARNKGVRIPKTLNKPK